MNKTLSLTYLLACVLLLVSCERETDEVFESETSNISSTISNEKNPDNDANALTGFSCSGTTDIFESQLQWVSSITVAVLQDNALAKTEFYNEFNSSPDGTIDIDRLIGPDAVNMQFSADFEAKLLWHIKNPFGHPSTTNPPPIPPHIGGFTSDDDNPTSFNTEEANAGFTFEVGDPYQAKLEGFYDTMLNQNCVELFIPNGLNHSGEFYSTSHPLTTATCNEAIKSVKDMWGWWGAQTYPSSVNQWGIFNNLIIARPERIGLVSDPSNPCAYTQYPGIDFTLFLN
ncbi:MAG: hypothetical protein KTR22_02675 [Flavobacteriaceae bacterium]|nr:hypothetical protein [Flavobacteriaceae bacterium]